MIWSCSICGEKGLQGHLEAVLKMHAAKSPNCPVNERPFVIVDGGVCVQLTVDESRKQEATQ